MNNLVVIERLLEKSRARSMKKLRKIKGVTIHETGNVRAGANAESHSTYLHVNGGKDLEVSYHYVVDEDRAYHFIPDDEVAWHAGDGGNGVGNNETIAIELCVNFGGDFNKTMENGAKLAANVLRKQGYKEVIDGAKDKSRGNLFQHNTFSPYKKNCPRNIRDNKRWDEFVSAVKKHLNGETEKIYRVQVGAFRVKSGADDLLKKLNQKGFEGYII